MTLVLNNDGMAVKMEGEHLVVKNHVDGSASTIPLVSVARVFVLGAPAITYPVIIALMERDIPCVFMAKSGRVRGSLDIWGGSFSRRRMQQYDLFRDPSRRMELSRGLVRAKLANCRRVIQRLCANRHVSINELDENWRMVNGCLARLDSARSIDELRGLEGKAGYGYFRLLGAFFPERFPFVERTRRPPKDPANALLSYVYMLLASEMEAVIRAHLLDAGFGFMHCDKLSAPALALDLMEPFRPGFADLLALNLLGHARLDPERDFERDVESGGVHLAREARGKVLSASEQALSRRFLPVGGSEHITLRQAMERQVMSLVNAIEKGAPMEYYKLI